MICFDVDGALLILIILIAVLQGAAGSLTPEEALVAKRSRVKLFEDTALRGAAPELPWDKPWQWWTVQERHWAKSKQAELKRDARNAAKACNRVLKRAAEEAEGEVAKKARTSASVLSGSAGEEICVSRMGRGISVEELCSSLVRAEEHEMFGALPQLDGVCDENDTFWLEGKALAEALRKELVSSGECRELFQLSGESLDVCDVLDYKTGMPLPAYKVIFLFVCLVCFSCGEIVLFW